MDVDFNVEHIVSTISAIGISTIVSTLFTFVQNNKKNNIDFVTKERSEWREKLKEILSELSDDNKKEYAIIKLKSEINPYGRDMDIKKTKPYYMKEGHIWDLLNGEKEIDFKRLAVYIELLLKFDWERSKKEVGMNPYQAIQKLINFFLLFVSLYCIYLTFTSLNENTKSIFNIINFTLSFVAFLFTLLQFSVTKAIISNPSKKKNEQIWIFIFFYAFPLLYTVTVIIGRLRFGLAFYIIAIMLVFVYEIYYLYLFNTHEDTYVREIERYLKPKNNKTCEGIQLANQIRNMENKLYRYEYDILTIKKLNKRLKKLKRKLMKRERPSEYLIHPILFCRYRKNRNRIIKEVKKFTKGETK